MSAMRSTPPPQLRANSTLKFVRKLSGLFDEISTRGQPPVFGLTTLILPLPGVGRRLRSPPVVALRLRNLASHSRGKRSYKRLMILSYLLRFCRKCWAQQNQCLEAVFERLQLAM